MSVDPKQFWETKILRWEQGRYGRPESRVGVVEWIADRSSMSLRFRVAITPELLRPHLANKHVVELGCGSGLLAGKLMEYGAASYLGIDLAQPAIEKARQSYSSDNRIQFVAGDVAALNGTSADLVISLGLFDWLTDVQIASIFRGAGTANFLHAIAEKRPGLQQWVHRRYVQLAYGSRTENYRPRYLTCDQIRALAAAAKPGPCYVYRNWRLSFGAVVSSLPIGKEL